MSLNVYPILVPSCRRCQLNKQAAARHVSRRTCAAMTTKASTTNMHWNRDIVNIECDGIVCYVRRQEHRDG